MILVIHQRWFQPPDQETGKLALRPGTTATAGVPMLHYCESSVVVQDLPRYHRPQQRLDFSMDSIGLGEISEELKQVLSASDESSFLELLEKNLSAESHEVRRATIDALYDLLTDPTANVQQRRVRWLSLPALSCKPCPFVEVWEPN